MEQKHIDKIAGGIGPESSEGPESPGVPGAELPASKISSDFFRRNQILSSWNLLPVDSPEEYFSILFSRPDPVSGELVNFLQATGSQHFGDHHYNAIVYDLRSVRREDTKDFVTRAKRFDVTRDLHECAFIEGPNCEKVISSPVLYAGRRRTASRARTIWGIAIDLDDVNPSNLNDLIHWVDKLGYTPMPSMIVSSGGGLHLYYLFPKGVRCYPQTVKLLQRLKHNMTKMLWTPYFSSNKHPQLGQGIWQGFRIPGTPTKSGDKVIGFVPEVIPYYTAKELNKWFTPDLDELIDKDNKPLTDIEVEAIDNNKYIPSKLSFTEAQEKWPDWDPQKTKKGQYVCHRGLYDWWLERLKSHDTAVVTGHRYSCIMALVSFARKCEVPYEEVEKEAYSLVDWLDSLTIDEKNHFSRSDVADALKLYDQPEIVRFSRKFLEYHTNIKFNKAKRNGRTREQNLMIARTARDVNDKIRGVKWDTHNGRKKAKLDVQMWCFHHPYVAVKSVCAKELGLDTHAVSRWWWKDSPKTIPEAVIRWKHDHPGVDNKSQCAKDCAISRPTVIKWWNCTFEDAQKEYERIGRVAEKGLYTIKLQTQEYTHDMGPAINKDYNTDKKIAEKILDAVPGVDQMTKIEKEKLAYDVADTINYSDAQIEELCKIMMGVPEAVRPYVKIAPEMIAELRESMLKADFKEDLATLNEDMQQWPDELKQLWKAKVDEHK